MAILFRIDVDKPFGHHNLPARIGSKLSEDYGLHASLFLPYLKHCKAMIRYLNAAAVPAFFYFRNCTKPDAETLQLLEAGKHLMGFHAEDTRSIQSFQQEYDSFCKAAGTVNHFTKHGSGKLKLGRHHYAPYEPAKYLQWAQQLGLHYFSGNGIAASAEKLYTKDPAGFWPNAFWVEQSYRDANFNSLETFLDTAANNDVVLLTHPENFYTHSQTRNDIDTIIAAAKTKRVAWITGIPV